MYKQSDFEGLEQVDFRGFRIFLKPNPQTTSKTKRPRYNSTLRLYICLSINKNLVYAPNIVLRYARGCTRDEIQIFLESNTSWLERAFNRLNKKASTMNKSISIPEDKTLIFGEWNPKTSKHRLKIILLDYIAERAANLSKQMELHYTKIGIRDSLGRFGSCSANRLSFSLLLVFAPKEEVDYVIIHELAHITHKNHSSAFWSLVHKHCPKWQILRKNLKANYALYRVLFERI